VRLKVDQRAGQLSLPHLGITKTEKIELKHKTDEQIRRIYTKSGEFTDKKCDVLTPKNLAKVVTATAVTHTDMRTYVRRIIKKNDIQIAINAECCTLLATTEATHEMLHIRFKCCSVPS